MLGTSEHTSPWGDKSIDSYLEKLNYTPVAPRYKIKKDIVIIKRPRNC